MNEPTKRNHVDAEKLREIASKLDDQAILDVFMDIDLYTLLRLNIFLTADLLDMHEEGGVELSEWTVANAIAKGILGGDVHPRGSSILDVTPKPSDLLVAKHG